MWLWRAAVAVTWGNFDLLEPLEPSSLSVSADLPDHPPHLTNEISQFCSSQPIRGQHYLTTDAGDDGECEDDEEEPHGDRIMLLDPVTRCYWGDILGGAIITYPVSHCDYLTPPPPPLQQSDLSHRHYYPDLAANITPQLTSDIRLAIILLPACNLSIEFSFLSLLWKDIYICTSNYNLIITTFD